MQLVEASLSLAVMAVSAPQVVAQRPQVGGQRPTGRRSTPPGRRSTPHRSVDPHLYEAEDPVRERGGGVVLGQDGPDQHPLDEVLGGDQSVEPPPTVLHAGFQNLRGTGTR